ncbi:MAG: lysophospholipid acyltransferase family protein [bacterium]|nr:lysophospholipid acyltransferase family protein [bacterium]MDE0290455.1 lysophospholipid acyltransferase family protein [bacterium]MDE0437783.1 lysophospholipid acyltransferase family protein [bacterium]
MNSRPGLVSRVLWVLCWPPARLLATLFPYSSVKRCATPSGAYVAVINHLSHLDPPVAGLALRRPVRYLALNELWGNSAILDGILNVFEAIPFPREGRYPIGALKQALRHLDAGGIIGVFPEGRRVRNWGDAPVTRGAAWLAVKANVPLVPVAIWGTQHAMPLDTMRLHRSPVRVVVGCPIEPAGFAECRDAVQALTRAVAENLDREIRTLARDGHRR